MCIRDRVVLVEQHPHAVRQLVLLDRKPERRCRRGRSHHRERHHHSSKTAQGLPFVSEDGTESSERDHRGRMTKRLRVPGPATSFTGGPTSSTKRRSSALITVAASSRTIGGSPRFSIQNPCTFAGSLMPFTNRRTLCKGRIGSLTDRCSCEAKTKTRFMKASCPRCRYNRSR